MSGCSMTMRARRRPHRLHDAAAGVVLILLMACCTQDALAAVPADLTNFQNEYPCDPNATLIVRPRTIEDVAAAVAAHDYVMTVAEGHSWNKPFFCVQPGAPLNNSTAAAGAEATPASSQSGRRLQQAKTAPDNATATAVVDGQTTAAAAAANPAVAVNGAAPSVARTESNSSSLPAEVPAVVPKPSAANIVMTTIRPMNISVNETDESVWVDAGVKTIDLLNFLAASVSPNAPAGWTLAAFPWFVYQSVAGAVATGTHGSSMKYKSMSNQVLALDVILANGTRRVFTNETDPFLMKAWRVSVGKLGVIVRVQFRIVKEVPVRRVLRALTPVQLLDIMKTAQAAYAANGTIMPWMNETQIFWVVQKNVFMMVSFERADDAGATIASQALQQFTPDNTTVFTRTNDILRLGELILPADANIKVAEGQIQIVPPEGAAQPNNDLYVKAQRWLDGFMEETVNAPVAAAASDSPGARVVGARWTVPKPKTPSGFYAAENMAEGLMEISRLGIQQVAGNKTAEPNDIYIKQPKATLQQLQTVLYDQYEVSIPLGAVGSCWEKLLAVVYQGDLLGTNQTIRPLDKGFRTAPLIRFVGHEDGLLSHTSDGPRMYLNIEDYLFYNRNRVSNKRFKAVMATLTGDPACTAAGHPRLHWGKAGWPDPGCWHGDEHYGTSWCHFGCAAKQLDPTGKFNDTASDRWTWKGVDLEKCCGPDGFMNGTAGCECKVQHARPMSDCGPAPYYTTR